MYHLTDKHDASSRVRCLSFTKFVIVVPYVAVMLFKSRMDDGVQEVESVFGMRGTPQPYQFQPTFLAYRKRRGREEVVASAAQNSGQAYIRSSASAVSRSEIDMDIAGVSSPTPERVVNTRSMAVLSPSSERVGNTRWCCCGNCKPMSRPQDCTCCVECPAALSKKGPFMRCIASHVCFKEVCLSRHVLETAMAAYREFRVCTDTHQSNR